MGSILNDFKNNGNKLLPQTFTNEINKFISTYNGIDNITFFDLFNFILESDNIYHLNNSSYEISVFAYENSQNNFDRVIVETKSKFNGTTNTYCFKKDNFGKDGFFLDVFESRADLIPHTEVISSLLEEIFFYLFD